MKIGSQGAHSFFPGLDLMVSLHSVKSLYLPFSQSLSLNFYKFFHKSFQGLHITLLLTGLFRLFSEQIFLSLLSIPYSLMLLPMFPSDGWETYQEVRL